MLHTQGPGFGGATVCIRSLRAWEGLGEWWWRYSGGLVCWRAGRQRPALFTRRRGSRQCARRCRVRRGCQPAPAAEAAWRGGFRVRRAPKGRLKAPPKVWTHPEQKRQGCALHAGGEGRGAARGAWVMRWRSMTRGCIPPSPAPRAPETNLGVPLEPLEQRGGRQPHRFHDALEQ